MAAVTLSPYLHFNGNAEEALEFYKSVFGGEAKLTRFSDMPPMPGSEAGSDKIMHGDFTAPDVSFMASDGADDKGICNFQMALSGTDAEKLRAFYTSLAEGGEVTEPLSKAPWGDEFGQVVDKFGVKWMFNITGAPAA